MWKLQVLLYSFLIPQEFSISVGTLNLSTYRILLLLLAPWLIWRLLVSRFFKWRALDSAALFVCLWPTLALSINTDILSSIESGGVLFLETFVPFFMARQFINTYRDLLIVSKTLLIIASVMAALAIPEAITGKLLTHNIASFLTGNTFTHIPELRFGVWRSYGPTDHPIVLGSICAVALPLGWALLRRRQSYASLTGLSMMGVIASASSGPLLSVVAQILLYIWSYITKGNRYKWWLLIFFIIFVYCLIDILSNRDPFRVMFSYLLFNEHNGYVRYNMWINSFFLAGQSMQSLLVGYGFSTEMMSLLDNEFWTRLMSSSVDSYWMVVLLRYGMPMLFFNLLLLALVLRENVRCYRMHSELRTRQLIQAWLITTISLSLVACTVHFWGSTASLFFIVMGATSMSKKTLKPRNARPQSSRQNKQVRAGNSLAES